MAVIDTFLKLMVERQAERLILIADRVPSLLRKGETIELSMPKLREEMLRRISREISGDEKEDHGNFVAADGVEFGYRIQPDEPEWRIEVLVLGTAPRRDPSPADDPLTRAVLDFTQSAHTPPLHPVQASPGSPGPDAQTLSIFAQALTMNASDLFLSSGKPPRVRKNGLIITLDANPPAHSQILALLPDEESHRQLESTGSADFAVRWELPEGPRRVRINVFRHLDGLAAALRPIRRRAPQLSELSLPSDIHHLATFSNGLVLVTGAAGSGKSTTLAALVDHINRNHPRHIITLEDPVEYEHREIQCLIHQREVGANVESFATGLRAALRESPDVILLGELRDLDTIAAALTAAETGHLVLATLHAGSASTAVNRIVDVFPGHQQALVRTQLSLSLRAVLSQRLVPTRNGGLVPAVEKLLVTPAIANCIRESQDHAMRNAMLTGLETGMITLERSLANLVRERVIDREMAIRHASDLKSLLHQLT